MARFLSSTDLAIGLAFEAGTLRVTEHEGRFGSFIAFGDECGLIEVALTEAEAETRLASITAALAAS